MTWWGSDGPEVSHAMRQAQKHVEEIRSMQEHVSRHGLQVVREQPCLPLRSRDCPKNRFVTVWRTKFVSKSTYTSQRAVSTRLSLHCSVCIRQADHRSFGSASLPPSEKMTNYALLAAVVAALCVLQVRTDQHKTTRDATRAYLAEPMARAADLHLTVLMPQVAACSFDVGSV